MLLIEGKKYDTIYDFEYTVFYMSFFVQKFTFLFGLLATASYSIDN